MTSTSAFGIRFGIRFHYTKKRRHQVTTLQRLTVCPDQDLNLEPSGDYNPKVPRFSSIHATSRAGFAFRSKVIGSRPPVQSASNRHPTLPENPARQRAALVSPALPHFTTGARS